MQTTVTAIADEVIGRLISRATSDKDFREAFLIDHRVAVEDVLSELDLSEAEMTDVLERIDAFMVNRPPEDALAHLDFVTMGWA